MKPDEVHTAQPSGEMAWDKGRFFRVLFTVNKDIQERADRLADEIGLGEPGSYSALHLRLGHGVDEGKPKRFSRWQDMTNLSACIAASTIISYENVQNARNHLSRPLSEPPRIFVATDTHSIFPDLKQNFESIWTKSKVVIANVKPTHSGHVPTEQVAKDVWVELVLLSRSRYFFVAIPSGFSNLAGCRSHFHHRIHRNPLTGF